MIRILALSIFLLFGCENDSAGLGPDAALIDAQEKAQGSAPRSALVINEIFASPQNGASDWIELYNRSSASLDLCNFFVTDSLGRLDHYYHLGTSAPPLDCNPRYLEPGAYMIVFADGDTSAGKDHAPFSLGKTDETHVVSAEGIALDSLFFSYPSDGHGKSLSRLPNGDGLFWLSEPTQGTINQGSAR